jgi:8-oxo-(d)GTP phosphatase
VTSASAASGPSGPSSTPIVVVRHASAGDRDSWTGRDENRPLDEVGRRQAAALVGLLRAYDIRRIHSSEFRRCRETVAPLAEAQGLPVDLQPLLGERDGLADVEAATQLFADLVRRRGAAVLSTQRKVVDAVLPSVLRSLGATTTDIGSPRKGGLLVLHVTAAGTLRALDSVQPPA